MIRLVFFIILIFVLKTSFAQFSPAVGEIGSTAINKDSSIIISWADECIVKRGFLNIEDTNYYELNLTDSTNKAYFGYDSLATGKPLNNTSVVSLGDGGYAILKFNNPIKNGNGFDFAVFENGFKASENNYFLELAFVEVSSDGINFVRFPSSSLTQDSSQIESFGYLNPQKINNLAGKYINDYGTPFDLEELVDSQSINIDSIVYVKIIDVVGDINSNFCSFDSYGNKINDPFPTMFSSGGFDLNGVGVINQLNSSIKNINHSIINIYPNPASKYIKFDLDYSENTSCEIFDILGNLKKRFFITNLSNSLYIYDLPNGVYLLKINNKNKSYIQKFIKN